MSLFTVDDVQHFKLDIELPEIEKDYVKIIIEDVPIGKLKTESLVERDDRFSKLLDFVPEYVIFGKGIQFSFHKNKFSIELGSSPLPSEIIDIVEREPIIEELFEKDFISKISMDVNYLLGFILSLTGEKFNKFKISGSLRLLKKNSISVPFSKIINLENLKKISEKANVSGVLIKNDDVENKWRYYIRYDDEKLSVTSWYESYLDGTLDLYEIIEKYIIILNDIILKM